MDKPFPAYVGDDPYVFVCYAHEDDEVVYPEISWLRDQGINIWYDEGISPGSIWRDEVALALTQCKVFLYYITPRSVGSSNCLKELNFSLSRERRILSIHLENTKLPIGLELSLSDMQAIMREEYPEAAYQTKLVGGLRTLMPQELEPPPISASPSITDKTSDDKSIAILPLVNRNLGAENEYLCDGISEELINGLSQVDELRVASQLSAFAFKNQDLDVKVIGDKLNVKTVLSGSVQKAGNRVRINVRLNRVQDGSTMWSHRYDQTLDDIFELQDDVAKQVIDALKIELGADQKDRLINVGTKNIDAYNTYLLGVHEWRSDTQQSSERAIEYFKHAIQLDVSFGRAYWELYVGYTSLQTVYGVSEETLATKAEEAASRARENAFVPPYPWAEVQRRIHPESRPDQRQLALEACDKIRHPDPTWRSYEYQQFAECLEGVGLFHGALDYFEKCPNVVQLDTRDTYSRGPGVRIKFLLSCIGRFDKAIELWTEHIATHADDHLAIGDRALLYIRTGQYEKAEQDLETLVKVFPRNFPQFYDLYWRREIDAAKAYFGWLESRKNLTPLYKFWGCFLLGEIEKGLDYVEEAVRRNNNPFMLRTDLHRAVPHSIAMEVDQHPRFQALFKRFGLDDAWRDELIEIANDLTDITGIHVQQDDAY